MTRPIRCILELTVGCNLRCIHCGSSCSEPLNDELTTDEFLKVAEDLAALKLDNVTLSGGEPLLRQDWAVIAKKLNECGVGVSIVTNGSLIDKDVIEKFIECNITQVSVSIDGTEEIHNEIRGDDAYRHCVNAFAHLNHANAGFRVSAITTVLNKNLENLSELRDALIGMGVRHWQIQPGLPEGNLAKNADANKIGIISPADIIKLIDFAYGENIKGNIWVHLPDTVGYNTKKEVLSRQMASQIDEIPIWKGCSAGIRALGVLSNGDVVGCTSMRRKAFCEGNVRERSLIEIWNDEKSFAWRKNLTPDKLAGVCKTCTFAQTCLGGCSNIRLTTKDTIYSENEYCAYHAHLRER